MKHLKVLLINDGKPGHRTQSEGLVNYLMKHFTVEKQELRIKPKLKIANRLLRYLLNNNSRLAFQIFSWFYSVDGVKNDSYSPHLIISTGGDTCGVNAALAIKFRCSNFYLGSIRGHKPELFTAIITTVPLSEVPNNIVLDVAPTLIDRDVLEQAGSKFLAEHGISNKNIWVMLIGGDGSGYNFSKGDYADLVDGMLELAKRYSIRWLVTTSRRTRKSNEQFLKSLLAGRDEIIHAVYFNENPQKVMLAYLGAAELIFCTEDSTSMVSEAVISGKPVFTLRGSTEQINSGHLSVINKFASTQAISRLKTKDFPTLSIFNIKHKVLDPYKNYDKIFALTLDSIQ